MHERIAEPLFALDAGADRVRAGVHAVAGAWLGTASAALAGAALVAIALLVLKVPGIDAVVPLAGRLFPTGLALHVNLASHVWLLCFGAAVTAIAFPPRRARLAWGALGMVLSGTAAVVAAAGLGARAVMSNYVPVIDHPLFFAGCAAIAAASVFMCSAALWRPAAGGDPAIASLLRTAAWAMIAAFVVLGAAFGSIPEGLTRNAVFEVLFWGFGHVLQIAFVLWMLAGWCALADDGSGKPVFALRLATGTAWLVHATLAIAIWIAASEPVASVAYRESFTRLMAWGGWLAPAAFLAVAIGALRGQAARPGIEFMAWSALLFAAGCIAGIFIRAETTLVPAHYHGTIGAVTLTSMAWSMQMRAGAAGAAASRTSLRAYGAGLALLVAGLAWLGRDGTPRKALASVLSADSGAVLALALAVGGGVLASLAAIAFAVGSLRSAGAPLNLGGGAGLAAASIRDARPRAIAIGILLIVFGGASLSWLSGESVVKRRISAGSSNIDARVDAEGHARSMRRIEFDTRFRQAVVMLHARRYEHAATALHRLLIIAPEVPEVHVNMGFAMIGLKRFEVARGFFTGATELRPAQANAYYGLALALDGLGELPAALGAMRTFVHLTVPGDPYLPKARAAIWEWQTQLATTRAASGR